MLKEKTCRKCDKPLPSNTVFCPDCGSLAVSPEMPAKTPPADTVRPRRTSKGTPIRSLPVKSPPVRVRVEFSRADFDEALVKNKVPEEDIEVVGRLIEWSEGVSDSASFGDSIAEGGRVGYRPKIDIQGKGVSLFWVSSDGKVEISFEDWIHVPPFDSREKRLELLKKLNEIKGVKIAGDKIAGHPPVPVRMLRDKVELDKFIEAYEWFIGLVQGP